MIDKKLILKGLKIATDAGWRVRTKMASISQFTKCGCALSVAAVGLGYYPRNFREAAEYLGLTPSDLDSFVNGFDYNVGSCQFARDLRRNCFAGVAGTAVIP